MPSSPEAQFALLAFSSLFSVINPISAAPIFVAMTSGSPADRRRAAVRACLAAFAVLAIFAVAGGAIFTFFGITVPAFQIAGGLIFALLAHRLEGHGPDHRRDRSPVRHQRRDHRLHRHSAIREERPLSPLQHSLGS